MWISKNKSLFSGRACCAIAIKNMEIIVREKLAENAARVVKYILSPGFRVYVV